MASTSKTPKDYPPFQEKNEEEEEEEERDWLELGLGLSSASARTKQSHKSDSSAHHHHHHHHQYLTSSSSSYLHPQPNKPELGLGLGLGFEYRNQSDHVTRTLPPPPLPGINYYQMGHHNLYHHHYDMPSSPSLSSSFPLHIDSTSFNLGLNNLEYNDHNTLDHYLPSSRPHDYESGLWFTLRSSVNRNGEELPQLQKAYIRVKDDNVTVFMVKTYLVRKLGLSSEDQIDISCMGQKLLHSRTLKHVRDAIWLPRLVESTNSRTALILENSRDMPINYLMSLNYGRRCLLN